MKQEILHSRNCQRWPLITGIGLTPAKKQKAPEFMTDISKAFAYRFCFSLPRLIFVVLIIIHLKKTEDSIPCLITSIKMQSAQSSYHQKYWKGTPADWRKSNNYSLTSEIKNGRNVILCYNEFAHTLRHFSNKWNKCKQETWYYPWRRVR